MNRGRPPIADAEYSKQRRHYWALSRAIAERNFVRINELIKEGGLNDPSNKFLKIAIQNGDYEMAEFLIDNGADVTDGDSLLYWAVMLGEFDIAVLLLENGADVNYIYDIVDDMVEEGYHVNSKKYHRLCHIYWSG